MSRHTQERGFSASRLFRSGLFVLATTMAWGLTAVVPRAVSAAMVTQNLTTSSSGSLQTRWYSLRGYGSIPKNEVNWPQRSDGCPWNGVPYKISPWQPAYGFFNGNTMNQSSNCFDRYTDAGTWVNGGAWIHPDAQWGWALPNGPQSFNWRSGAFPAFSTVMGGCSNGSLIGGNAAAIWGASGPDLSDQFYSPGPIGTVPGFVSGLYYDQYPSGRSQPTKLYSNGVTLVRDHFDLSATDIGRLSQAGTHLYFQAYADDWLQVYVNGAAVGAYSTSTTGEVTLDLTTIKGSLVTGTNWLGVMVADKAIFDTVDPGGRGAGVCYNLQYQYNQLPPFDLQPIVGATVMEGGVAIPGNEAQVGDTINFNYAVRNNNVGDSDPANCTVYANVFAGYHGVPGPPDKGPVAPVATGCPRVFPGNSTTGTGSESIPATTVNQTICRSLYVNPAVRGGGERGSEACIAVVARPYLKVFGGDISAGNGFANSMGACASSNSAIISWNQRATPYYPGAGTQYAALALNVIFDFSSAQGTNTAGARAPSDLAFANSTITGANKASGTFGKTMGTAPCATDYYAGKPATVPPASPNVAAMPGPAYGSTSGLNGLGGTVATGQRTIVYVLGNVYISNNIVYAGSGGWSYNTIPMFELVVKGNIYIARGVTRLDGAYIAEPNGASGGTIYTCATGVGVPVDPTNPSFRSLCNNQLTVNGSFVSAQTRLLRTFGTLNSSTANESAGASNAGEIFNFNPTLWIAQPKGAAAQGATNNYDAITGLPPVL